MWNTGQVGGSSDNIPRMSQSRKTGRTGRTGDTGDAGQAAKAGRVGRVGRVGGSRGTYTANRGRRRPPRWLVLIALLAYSAVMVSLTMLKAFFVIGLLWEKDAHRNRSLELTPFDEYTTTGTWFAPLFGYGGNLAFFIPFGVLLYVLLRTARRAGRRKNAVLKVTAVGALFSLLIEICQYLFSLGYSDIDDLIFNTLGAFVGAVSAKVLGPRFHWLWVWMALILGVVFAVLVGLGPRLGDPDKVVEIYAISWDGNTVLRS